MKTDNQEQVFIEKFGLFCEKTSNFPRIAGKIFAYLLICDPPEQTQQQIVESLNIAKGSASTMVRMLTQSQIIEELTKPGMRPKFYRLRNKGWEKLFLAKLQSLAVVRNLLEEGRSLLKDKPSELAERIEELDNLYAFFERELPLITTKWQEFNPCKGETK